MYSNYNQEDSTWMSLNNTNFWGFMYFLYALLVMGGAGSRDWWVLKMDRNLDVSGQFLPLL